MPIVVTVACCRAVSVCPSVTLVYCIIKTAKHIPVFVQQSGSPAILDIVYTCIKTVCHNKITHCTTLFSVKQIQNCLARAVLKPRSSLTPLLFLNLYTGSKSISVLSTPIRFFLLHSPIKFLLLLNWLCPKFDLC